MKKNASLSIAILLIAVVLFSFTAVSADGKTSLVVGFDQDFPPYGFIGEDGEFTGYDLDMAAAAAELLGMEVVYQPIAWDAKDMELDSGTIDCIWNGFTINGREDKYEWTEAYKDAGQVILVKADSGIETFDDLSGKIVSVQTDSAALEALESEDFAELTASFADLVVVGQYNAAFMDLEAGAVDAIAMDIDVAYYQIEGKEADYKILDEMLQAEQYGVGFKLGNTELRDKVQGALEELVENGTFAEISEEWFGYDSCVLNVCQATAE
ncbi:MAG: amino acid ABC transporter substrate-binding protein [Flexilinea sp.]